MDLSELKAKIRDIKDFPTEGILFKDITTLLRDPRAFKYVLDELATEYQGRLTIVKVNVDDNPGTAQKYGVRGIPTLTLFKDGAVEATKVGALSKSQLTAFLDSNI